jgi:hypothetical protein
MIWFILKLINDDVSATWHVESVIKRAERKNPNFQIMITGNSIGLRKGDLQIRV